MIPLTLVPAIAFLVIFGSIGLWAKLSEDRDERRNRRP